MKIRHYGIFFVIMYFLLLAGCGGGGGGDTVVAYDTVILTATPASIDVDSDVATHTQSVSSTAYCDFIDPPPTGDTITVSPDDVNVAIASAVIPNLPSFVTPSAVRLDNVTITYTPVSVNANTSILPPPLTAQIEALGGQIVAPGGSLTLPVRVAPQGLKGSPPLSGLLCSGTIYTYVANINFEGVEVLSGRSKSFEAQININFSDFVAH